MERTDARPLALACLAHRTLRRAVQLRLAGMRLDEVVFPAEFARDAVIAAVKAYLADDWVSK